MTGFARMRRLVGVTVAVASATFSNVALAQQDHVITTNGKDTIYKVISEDFGGLIVAVEGGSTVIRWKDVDSIKYQGGDKYYKAISAFTSGSSEALAQLEELAADTKLRPVLRHGVLYHMGLAYLKSGASDKALASFQELLKTFPKSKHLLHVGTNVLSIYSANKDARGASAALEPALNAAGSGTKDASLQAGIDLLRAQLLEAQGQPADAEVIFSRVASTNADADLAAEGKLGRARCSQAAGRVQEAEQRYRELTTSDAPFTVLAGAWNGIGDQALAAGTEKKEMDTLRDAMFAYLHGVVLYVPKPPASTLELERALAGASAACKAIGELETDPARKKLNLDRARQFRDELARKFPRSRYVKP